ncbi:interleukin-4 receptor subunit alpha isoform X1 [Falco naumanni]|uniref:interleukin-4 receptor subunit alpha isoform X1 n=1 Tax=Falco naumanni TaxID=148594 RepID=UPI001ADE9AA9|nr:interleukin-4 receptor subunit alpha isoform X1 [Falco naumanni]XP_040449688.1 interleukin-4 receptor subunit alpha isoform X1 [Falco naumanni]
MMARLPSAALHVLWILFFTYSTSEVMSAGHVQEFACVTDYDKELVCHWKVPADINCSREFLLYYRKEFLSEQMSVCVPENEDDSLRCTCTICSDYFVSGLTYILTLQFNGTDMWNYSVTPALVVKPRAPKNLAIEKVENGNFNLTWEESYSPPSMLSGQPVIYEVKYWRKQHPTEVSVKTIKYQTKSFEITASSLRRGYDYAASVRCNYTDYPAYWSEWSDKVEFHYDYQVTAEDVLQMAVPVSCILIMAVSVTCYFCFTKVKKEWWDQIPNPAKSHLVVKNVKFSVLCYIDEIKFPFHDLKQSHMEYQISCKKCLVQSLPSQSFKGKDNIRNVEKSCSCHSKSGEWFPKGSSGVLTPETILIEESIEICECLTDIEAESQEETSDPITVFEPHENSVSALREHTEHNDALADMFLELLVDENNVQDNKDPGIITGKNKTFENLESENPSQQNPKESAAQSWQPCDISHTLSIFTKASQDDYNCSTASKKSEQSEQSFESGYRSSSTISASLDARDVRHMVHQSLSPCSSENQHDLCVLIQQAPNKTSSLTRKDRISNPAHESFDIFVSPSMGLCSSAYKSFHTLISPSVEPSGSAYKSFHTLISPSVEPSGSAYKSFDTLISPSVEPSGSAYKSCDTLISPSVEPSGSAYKSFDILVSAFKEPSSSVYKSFDTLLSLSMANSSLTVCFENMCSSPPLTQFSETLELSRGDEIYGPPSNQTCYTNYRSPCTELEFQNTCSEHADFPSSSTHVNETASVFLPEKEIHKQVTYQNLQKKANGIFCPIGSQPPSYQPFDNALKCNGTYSDNDSEVISRSLYEPFIHLLYNNLRETPAGTIICEPDQRTDDQVCLIVQAFDCSVVPGLASNENVMRTSDGSLWITNSTELPSNSKDENTSRGEQLLHLLEQNCQYFNNRERTMKWTKASSFNCAGKGMQESNSNRLNTDFNCHTHDHLRNAGENKEMIKHAVGRRYGSAASLPEESLDSTGLNLKSTEPLGSDEVSPPLFVGDFCPDSCTICSEGCRLAPVVKKSPVELLREYNRKNEKKMKLVQALAQEDNCYMKVA